MSLKVMECKIIHYTSLILVHEILNDRERLNIIKVLRFWQKELQ